MDDTIGSALSERKPNYLCRTATRKSEKVFRKRHESRLLLLLLYRRIDVFSAFKTSNALKTVFKMKRKHFIGPQRNGVFLVDNSYARARRTPARRLKPKKNDIFIYSPQKKKKKLFIELRLASHHRNNEQKQNNRRIFFNNFSSFQ